MKSLLEQKCVPCEKGEKPLERNEFIKYLSQVKKWDVIEDKELEKKFKFKDFEEALVFVNKVGSLAQSEGHHPNIYLYGWNKVRLTLTTHVINGLSMNDFILAAKVNSLV